ncbi:hypothetical protein FRX31_019883 [Thalictrum thalictroides]|uniref:Uncharacterized protein n=1 Tax=Thalictrum thalictroides TaxID=46969 RepID=A0A7J6VZH7_THATH|nr:hypothetical protein FRX31_019883 [Thalictrum thalictroides]
MATKASGYMEILRTNKLIKEVQMIFEANRPDPLELEKAKKALKVYSLREESNSKSHSTSTAPRFKSQSSTSPTRHM